MLNKQMFLHSKFCSGVSVCFEWANCVLDTATANDARNLKASPTAPLTMGMTIIVSLDKNVIYGWKDKKDGAHNVYDGREGMPNGVPCTKLRGTEIIHLQHEVPNLENDFVGENLRTYKPPRRFLPRCVGCFRGGRQSA